MNIRNKIVCLTGIFFLVLGVAAAQEDFPDVIEFDGAIDGGGSKDIHPSTYTGPVTFPHKQHFKDYGVSCRDCHHDASRSLVCGNCHVKEGLIRGPIAENAVSDDDLIGHRANALHLLCIGCHKKHNAQEHRVLAPESCRICHSKRSQDWHIE